MNGSGWCNGVEDIFLAHFGPSSTNWGHVYPFMTTDFLNMIMSSPDLYPLEHFWDVVEQEIHTADKSDDLWCHRVNMEQNVWEMFPAHYWIVKGLKADIKIN